MLCLLAGFVFCSVSIVESAGTRSTILVPDDYSTIQAAIDFAHEGDTILVAPGTYIEHLKIDKPLSVLGSGASSTIIESMGGGHTVEISSGAHNVVFDGFTLRGTDASVWAGIYIVRTRNNTIRNNVIVHHKIGVHIYDSEGNVLRNNSISHNKYNLRVWGLFLSHFMHDIDSSNTVDGKPVYYWVNRHKETVPSDAGFVALVNSSNVMVRNLNLTNNLAGVLLAYTKNSIITDLNASKNEYGLRLVLSDHNTIVDNNLSGNHVSGITAIASRSNMIFANRISSNGWSGLRLSYSPLLPLYSDNNAIIGNRVEYNIDGIYLETSNGNNISVNVVTDNERFGVALDASYDNVLRMNALTSNGYGVWIYGSSDNIFYHNNFLHNSEHASISTFYSSSVNTWDNGYPSGGNHWSDYAGADRFSGPNQDVLGGDGLGDSPYFIDSYNEDRYPLMKPSDLTEFPDVAVTDVAPSGTEVYIGQEVNVSVKVKNEGANAQTFTVALKYVSAGVEYTVETRVVSNLSSNEEATLTFSWTPVESGIYEVVAKAIELPTELDTVDNSMMGPFTVKVKVLGDINGDEIVDVRDLAEAAFAFGSSSVDELWNSQADLNRDGRVDIRDLVVIARNFGRA